jgi:uncharacterized protein YdhG (YjbR/CyaY superfamily)
MNGSNPKPETIDGYIQALPLDKQKILQKTRQSIRRAAPEAHEAISYRMPAFVQNGVLIYFAAFKDHIGLYPSVEDPDLRLEAAPYAGPKGNLQFPLAEPIPFSLITKIVKSRLKAKRQQGSRQSPKVPRAAASDA